MSKRSWVALYLTLLTAFSFLLYWEVFFFDTFAPEFPLFYFYTQGISFRQMLLAYTYNGLMWYRPTPFALFYWVGDQFIHWHNLLGWKLYHFATVLAIGYASYWLVVRQLGGSRLAGVLAGTYFIAQPTIYAFVMEMSGFDFVYVLVTILCVGFYLHAQRVSGGRSILITGLSWLLFVIGLTCKEVTLAIPFYLTGVSILLAPRRWMREGLRLAPFFAMLPVYYLFHLAKLPPEVYTGTGPYRTGVNWDVILTNARKLPLWIARIYCFTGETLAQKMYQSTLLNNAVGIASLALVAAYWIVKARRDPAQRRTLLLMLGWIAGFLLMPIYAGGYMWHDNLPVIGYCVLFGFAAAWYFERIAAPGWRAAALAAFFVGALLLGRVNLKVELHGGTHTAAFLVNQNLLQHPPAPPERLGKAPLVYIEDRLGLGPWWYGCFGKLFNFVYYRHDLNEVIVPALESVPDDLRQKWLENPNAFFFRYDDGYNWRDGSAEFRAAITGISAPRSHKSGP